MGGQGREGGFLLMAAESRMVVDNDRTPPAASQTKVKPKPQRQSARPAHDVAPQDNKPKPRRTTAEVTQATTQHAQLLLEIEELEKRKRALVADVELTEATRQRDVASKVVRRKEDIQQLQLDTSAAAPVDDNMLSESDDESMDVDAAQDDEDVPPYEDLPGSDDSNRGVAQGSEDDHETTEDDQDESKMSDIEVVTSQQQSTGSAAPVKINKASTVKVNVKKKKESAKTASADKNLAGINTDWLEKAKAQRRNVVVKDQSDVKEETREKLGGLTDEDAHDSVVPTPQQPVLRANKDVVFVDEQAQPTVTKAGRGKGKGKKPSPSTPAVPKPEPAPAITKRESSTQSTVAASEASNSQTGSVGALNPFSGSKYTSAFLPTLYHRFLISRDPWNEFSTRVDLLPKFIDVLQEVFDIVYPEYAYKITRDSAIVARAYQRICEKRSSFGSFAVTIVDAHFDKEQFKGEGGPREIRHYVQWALRSTGPLIWQDPTPQYCRLPTNDRDFINPDGIFASDWLVQIMAPHMKVVNNSAAKGRDGWAKPMGGIALAAAALERAFTMWKDGKKVDVSARNTAEHKFTKDRTQAMIDEYLKTLKTISKRRWKVIYAAYDTVTEEPTPIPSTDFPDDEAHDLAASRAGLYTPSSPVPEDLD